MTKKILIPLLVVGLLLMSVPVVLGASDQGKEDIAKLQKQIFDLKKQLVQKYVDNGQITVEQGKLMEQRMDQAYKNAEQNGFTPGAGCGGYGGGMMGGGMMGGPGAGYGYGQGFGSKPAPQSF